MNSVAKARMRQVFPGAPDWLCYSEGQRQAFAEMQMMMNRWEGVAEADNAAFTEYGYADCSEYWSDRLSEPMRARDFINLLTKHLRNIKEDGPGPERMFAAAFDLAQDMGEPWFFDGPRHKSLMLKPMEATRWLHSLPRHRHLVPSTLAALLTGEQQPSWTKINPFEHEPRRRGRRPIIREQVLAAMRAALAEGALSHERLYEMTEKELAHWFGASRDVVRGVRDFVLSENVGKTSPTFQPQTTNSDTF